MPSAAIRLLAALVLAVACGLSAAQGVPATPSAPIVPNPSLVDRPRSSAPSQRDPLVPAKPAAESSAPAPRLADFALVLPLASRDYARAAEAVRDGFLAAARAAGVADRTRVIGHEDGGVRGAFDAAEKLGARVIVGPLVRDDLRVLAAFDKPLPLTLALNQFDDGTPLPPSVYALTLSIEADARLLASRIRDDHIPSIALIGGRGPLDRRFITAFTDAWLAAGGGAPEVYRFDPASDALGELRRDLAKSNAQAAVVALPGGQAALARSFAPRLRAYASSLVNEPMDFAALADLEGVVFVDLPWLVRPADNEFVAVQRPDLGSNVLQRLYALGLDAFAVARAFAGGVPDRLDIAGATGRLTLGEGGSIQRSGALATFRSGQVVPADGPR
jgi:outer membrane PBP1 activator LpoA protein